MRGCYAASSFQASQHLCTTYSAALVLLGGCCIHASEDALLSSATAHAYGLTPISPLGITGASQGAGLLQHGSRLEAAEAVAANLVAENRVLRKQLNAWHVAGEHVAARERQLGTLLAEAAGEKLTGKSAIEIVGEGNTGKSPVEVGSAYFTSFGSFALPLSTPSLSLVAIQICTLVFIMSVFCLWRVCYSLDNSKDAESRDAENQRNSAKASPFKARALARFSSLTGTFRLSDYTVSVNEIQMGNVGHLVIRGNIYCEIQIDQHVSRTSPVPPPEGTFVTFRDVLSVNINQSDGPCAITFYEILDGGNPRRIGYVHMPSRHLVSFARQMKEYFRFNITLEGDRHSIEGGEADLRNRPYLALRLKDESQEHEKKAGKSALKSLMSRTNSNPT